tara:strand:+ start:23491 stop:23850 length:360 start_codon:yes stop_codon:yes gene_type:complete
MPWPTLPDIKNQCVIDADNTSDDVLLDVYLLAARDHISQKLNRKLYDLTSDIALDPITKLPLEPTDLALDMPAGDSIHLACLLVVAHWYVNRESTSTLTVKEVPMAFNALLEPYRVIPI